MGRDNNVMVITMVLGVLGFWIIVVVFARRADSSDEEKVHITQYCVTFFVYSSTFYGEQRNTIIGIRYQVPPV